MIKRKLRGYVIPTIYVIAIGAIILSIMIIGKNMQEYVEEEKKPDDTKYVMDPVVEDTTPVNQEQTPAGKTIRPYKDQNVQVIKEFYEKDADEAKQQNALIYYEGTYMQNSGILFGNDKEFDVIAVMDGKVKNIKEDNLLGIVVEIEHNDKLTTVYQSLKETNLTVGAAIKQGEVIGISGKNKIDTKTPSSLLFEVYHNGTLINPNNFFDKDLKEFSA